MSARSHALAFALVTAVSGTLAPCQKVVPYGCGVNPTGSLAVSSGAPIINTTMRFTIDNPLGTQGCASFTGLLMAAVPDPAFPCGTQIPGLGMAGPGAPGEMLLDLATPIVGLAGPTWGCSPVNLSLSIPAEVRFIGQKLYAQAVIADPFYTSGVGIGLGEAIELTFGPDPVALDFGGSVSRSVNPGGEYEVFEFTPDVGDRLHIPFARTSQSGFSLALEVRDPDDAVVTSTSGTSGTLQGTIAKAGVHRLVVTSGSGVTGSYHLTLQRTTNPGNSVALAIGDSRSASISYWTEIDVYSISANSGDDLYIPFARTSQSGFSLQLQLRDAAGTVLDSASGASGVFQPESIPATGEYDLWVLNPGRNVTGSYHLTIQRRQNPGNTVDLGFGDSKGGSITRWTEVDVFEFAATAGDTLFLPWSRTSQSGFSLQVELRDAQGGLVAADTPGASGLFRHTIPSTGDYDLWVYNPGLNVTGSYVLTLERTNSPVQSTLAVAGQLTSGAISWNTEVDVFHLTSLANWYMDIQYNRTSQSGFSLELRLYDSAGNLLQTCSGASGRTCVQVPSIGQYYLFVRNPGVNVTGTYNFTWNLTNVPVPLGCKP